MPQRIVEAMTREMNTVFFRLYLVIGFFLIVLITSCNGLIIQSDNEPVTSPGITGTKQIEIDLTYTPKDPNDQMTNQNYPAGNVYVIWLESSNGKKQNLFISKKLRYTGITKWQLVLPYWHQNKYAIMVNPDYDSSVSGSLQYIEDESNWDWLNDLNDIDAVTGATLAQQSFTFPDDFTNLNGESLANTISNELGDEFTLYFETDQSSQFNDWFNVSTPGTQNYSTPYDEPAVLYSVDINLADSTSTYTLTPEGWTPHLDFSSTYFTTASSDGTTGTTLTAGVENTDMRYITHSKVSDDFGVATPANSSTSLISSITATITDTP